MNCVLNKIDRILVPIDFSRYTDSVLATAAFLAKAHSSSVELVHVWRRPFTPAKAWGAAAMDDAARPTDSELAAGYQHALDVGKRSLAMLGVNEVTCRLIEGTASNTILDLVAQGNFDLIVMGNHGQTGLPQAYVGSVTERVVRSSRLPVLVVPSPEPRNDE